MQCRIERVWIILSFIHLNVVKEENLDSYAICPIIHILFVSQLVLMFAPNLPLVETWHTSIIRSLWTLGSCKMQHIWEKLQLHVSNLHSANICFSIPTNSRLKKAFINVWGNFSFRKRPLNCHPFLFSFERGPSQMPNQDNCLRNIFCLTSHRGIFSSANIE